MTFSKVNYTMTLSQNNYKGKEVWFTLQTDFSIILMYEKIHNTFDFDLSKYASSKPWPL